MRSSNFPIQVRCKFKNKKSTRTVNELINEKTKIVVFMITKFVRVKGIEPPRLTAPDPKSGASTNFATSAVLGWRKDRCEIFSSSRNSMSNINFALFASKQIWIHSRSWSFPRDCTVDTHPENATSMARVGASSKYKTKQPSPFCSVYRASLSRLIRLSFAFRPL